METTPENTSSLKKCILLQFNATQCKKTHTQRERDRDIKKQIHPNYSMLVYVYDAKFDIRNKECLFGNPNLDSDEVQK